MKKQIFFTVIILSLILAGMALSAVPTETWHGLKIFADGLYVKDANTVVIDPNTGITSSKPFNNITITAPPTPATLTIASGQTLYCPTSATVSGNNTGDQDLSGYVPTSRTINGNALTGNITLYAADVGLDQVNNTSDPNKPISSLQQAALDLKVSQSTGKSATVHNSVDIYGTDSTIITFPSSSCSLAAVTSGKSATIHNSVEIYGTDSTEITLPSVTSKIIGVDPNGLSSCAESIYGIYIKDDATGTVYKIHITNGEIYATQ